jgi:hypothetical protein
VNINNDDLSLDFFSKTFIRKDRNNSGGGLLIYFVECPCLSLSCCEFESHSGKVYSIQHYVINVSDLWQVWGFLQFPPPCSSKRKYYGVVCICIL